ncbi:MAG: hypothetical protein ACRD7E_03080, partial [Bryobacteraceae bacterium]
RTLTPLWPTSNPRGYGIWFQSRFERIAAARRRFLVESGAYKSIDAVPVYALKTPLQSSIQVLKRHRDYMYRSNSELKPISMILTTLSALSYRGEENVHEALAGILDRMPMFVRDTWPKVPNPVNPGEDFADKWRAEPVLEENFWHWYDQACRDFRTLSTSEHRGEVERLTEAKWGITLTRRTSGPSIVTASRRSAPLVLVEDAPKPWGSSNAEGPSKAPR